MKPSRNITLFAPLPPLATGSSSFMVSMLAHCVVLGLAFLVLSRAVRVDDTHIEQQYTVRILHLHGPTPQIQAPQIQAPQIHWSPGSDIAHPVQSAATHANPTGGQPVAAALQQLAREAPAPVTLIQTDVPPNTLVPQITPIPTVVILSPEHDPVMKIVPPPLQKAAMASVRPALTAPNHEWNVSDVNLSASTSVTRALLVPASTTSPLAIPGPQLVKIPEMTTTSDPASQPTPTTVVSISDLAVPEGTIALPLANETAPGSISESPMPGRPDSASETGSGKTAGQQDGSGTGPNAGGQGNPATVASGLAENNGAATGIASGPDTGPPSENGSANGSAVDRITLPKDGQFGFVVVGSSLAEEYPETLGIWADRLAYTVYLHVGAAKSWILQYSLPRAKEAAGNTDRPDAPWPYLIVRPHLALNGFNSDAVMVHGMIDTGGRFEQLAVVFPPQFGQAKFVLGALRQWQFRPAMQNGQATAVEVLLIIPDESE